MARATLQFLSREEEQKVHDKSVALLEKFGILVRSPSVLKMLADHGANVDDKGMIARIPESLVRESLSKAAKGYTLCGRDPKDDIRMPSDRKPHLTSDGLTLYILDIDTGKKRDATRKDFAEYARLCDALDAIDFFWFPVTISDAPQDNHSDYELWTAMQNTTLHVQGDCTSAEDAKRQIALASLVAGGEEELRKRPIFSAATNPISPMSFDKGAVEAQVTFAKAGIPILCHSMSMSGMSSPVTVAGTIVNINAENLASITISQCASPGAPHIYGSSSCPIDMKTGSMNFSAPEHLMISAAAGQMAKRYGRPCMVADWGTGRAGPGIQTSMTENFAYIASTLANSDLVSGAGGLDSAKGCSLAQLVLDCTIWESFMAFLRDFSIDDETVSFEALEKVGHGNSFLTSPHTARHFKKELVFWSKESLAMEKTYSDEMLPAARDKAKKLLKEHKVEPLDRATNERGEAMLREFSKSKAH